jgi:putative oxidoreductase
MTTYPFLSLSQALVVARLGTALFFMAHAMLRIVNGTIPRFGAFMDQLGFPNGVAVVWIITSVEILAGLALVFNRFVRVAATALFAIALGGITLIHRHNGWFVGEHGTGGMEYSFALMVLLLVVACADPKKLTHPK